jgi:hypothetical protein
MSRRRERTAVTPTDEAVGGRHGIRARRAPRISDSQLCLLSEESRDLSGS